MLTCSCDYDQEPGMVVYFPPEGYSVYGGKRSCRCSSCRELIRPGDTIAQTVRRWKVPETLMEEKIYGEGEEENGPARAPLRLCERCADLYFSLEELGFCIGMAEDMHELAKEYAMEYGPEKEDSK